MPPVWILLLACALAAAPARAAERKAFPLAYGQHDFPNGLRLITVPTDYPNVVALYVVVQTGSRNEVEPGKSGFAHLFEHMMFRGTKAFPTARYEAALKQAGAASNAYTTDDHTAYHTTFSKEDLEGMLAMEADRFQNLAYSEDVFRTEALAVLGEYNKNSAAPTSKLFEVLRETAFDKHTYRHTTMGFLKDIENMPNLYEYSREFFRRYYRPEYTTIIVVGDVKPETVRALVAKHWGGWKRGDYRAGIPVEPPQTAPRTNHVAWPTPTLPWVVVAFRAPAYSDTDKESAALDLAAALGFSKSSELYQKLVIEEQKADLLDASNPRSVRFQVAGIDDYLRRLSEQYGACGEDALKGARAAIEELDLPSLLQAADGPARLGRLLVEISAAGYQLSDQLALRFFTHVDINRQTVSL